jgi:hypothetical protein
MLRQVALRDSLGCEIALDRSITKRPIEQLLTSPKRLCIPVGFELRHVSGSGPHRS